VYSVLGDRLDCAELLLKAGANVRLSNICLDLITLFQSESRKLLRIFMSRLSFTSTAMPGAKNV